METVKKTTTNHTQTNYDPPETYESVGYTEMGEDEENELHLMEQFMENPAHDYRRLKYGDTIEGTVMRIDKDSILVDIRSKAEGVVPHREMQSITEEERQALHVGSEVLVFVLQSEGKEGSALLSIDKARLERSWRYLHQLYETGDVVSALVVNYNKGGLLVELHGIRGFVPSSQVAGVSRAVDAQKQSDMARMVGKELELKVIEINRSRNRLILSERQAAKDTREEKKDELLSSLQEGDVCHGVVSSLCDFGAFIDIGGADGLVHLSELSWGRIVHPKEILTVGQEVNVVILSIDHDRKRIALSFKRTQPEPWETVNERYELGQIVEGTITQLAPFGAFACIEDGIEGLIHISELSDKHVQHPRDIVKEGDILPMRVIRIDPNRKRMGLSCKLKLSHNDRQESAEHQEPTVSAASSDTDAKNKVDNPDTGHKQDFPKSDMPTDVDEPTSS
jgi:small subunit ribosomal protein S1